MKLSEFTTETALDVLCEIAPYATNIVTDVELLDELKSAVDFEEAKTLAEKIALVTGKITKILPIVLKKRKSDLFGIVAALNGKSAEDIARQSIIVTMGQVRDICADRELLGFFKSCTGAEGSE